MTIEEKVLKKLRGLSPEKQKEVLAYMELLESSKGSSSFPAFASINKAISQDLKPSKTKGKKKKRCGVWKDS